MGLILLPELTALGLVAATTQDPQRSGAPNDLPCSLGRLLWRKLQGAAA